MVGSVTNRDTGIILDSYWSIVDIGSFLTIRLYLNVNQTKVVLELKKLFFVHDSKKTITVAASDQKTSTCVALEGSCSCFIWKTSF